MQEAIYLDNINLLCGMHSLRSEFPRQELLVKTAQFSTSVLRIAYHFWLELEFLLLCQLLNFHMKYYPARMQNQV